MARKVKKSDSIDAALGKGVNYEVALAEVVRRSERRAWFVAFSAVLMALILAGGYFMLLPLKERTPFLVVNDVYTGVSTVARLEGNLGAMTANEAVTRSNISRYINSRESYDNVQYGMRDRRVVYAMSTPEVASTYSAQYSRGNPDSLVDKYGKTRAIRVEIISVVPLGGKFGGEPGRDTSSSGDAQVRFRRLLVDKTNGTTMLLDTKLATLRYRYNKDLRLNDRESVENPLRFQVTSYRVDNEALTSNVLPADVSGDNLNEQSDAHPDRPTLDALNPGHKVAPESAETIPPSAITSQQGAPRQ